VLRRFHRLALPLRHNRTPLLLGALCLPAHAAAMLAFPMLLGQILDQLSGSRELPPGWTIGGICGLLAGLALIEGLLRYTSRRLIIDASRRIEEQLKNALASHVLSLPIRWFDQVRTGDLVSRFTQDVELLRFLVGPVLLHGGSALFVVPGGLALMLWTSVPVTIACTAGFGLMAVGLKVMLPRIQRAAMQVQEAIGEVSQRAQEDFSGIRTVQGFGMEAREQAALARRQRKYLVAQQDLARRRAGVNTLLHIVGHGVVLAVLAVGGFQILGGHMSVGQLVEFLAYLGLMLWPLQAIGWSIGTLPRGLAAADRIEEVFAQDPEPTAGAHPDGPGRLEIRNLSFRYEAQREFALQGIDFVLEPGASLGIVGAVGSGKSTLLSVILRFYDPPPGTVFLDGVDILELAPDALRAHFALAPQEPFLFSDTIAKNVALAGEHEGLDAAIHTSALDQDLELFSHGLGTVVGERGVTLSGGQRQRVSLARALAADRGALILDDTLSAVDVATEGRILERMRNVAGDRSLIVISHRLSAVRHTDQILVLDRGRVAERGTHDELLARGGRYAEAWALQQEGQALEGPGSARERRPADASDPREGESR